jgi:ribosome biogenesis protein ENP2
LSKHFDFVSEDWSKLCSLQSSKLNLFTKGGLFASVSLPLRCQTFAFDFSSAEIILGSEGFKLFRLNLEQGKYEEPITCFSEVTTSIVISSVHRLIVAGSEEGRIEFFDPRDFRVITGVNLEYGVSSLRFDSSGMKLGVGLSEGKALIFDIRSSKPLLHLNHRTKTPINSVFFHSSKKIITSDSKSCRITEEDGTFFTSFETKSQINSILPYDPSGLIFAAVEKKSVQAILIPDLGSTPNFVSHLDEIIAETSVVEEEGFEPVDGMKFITRDELEQLDVRDLVNSSVLKPFMHGYYIPRELYRMLVGKSANGDYKDFVRNIRNQRREREQKDLIVSQRKAPKKDLGDLQINDTDSKRSQKIKKARQNDPYYE